MKCSECNHEMKNSFFEVYCSFCPTILTAEQVASLSSDHWKAYYFDEYMVTVVRYPNPSVAIHPYKDSLEGKTFDLFDSKNFQCRQKVIADPPLTLDKILNYKDPLGETLDEEKTDPQWDPAQFKRA